MTNFLQGTGLQGTGLQGAGAKRLKKLVFGAVAGGLLGLAGIVLSYQVIAQNATGRVFDDPASIDSPQIALLLGTTPKLADGRANLYFEYRVAATLRLFETGKIARVIVSGDHSRDDYNEPEAFRARFLQAGIPDEKIHLDYAGFRTLDSVVRAKEVFGQSQVLIVSQRFHNERAIYLADHFGLRASAFNAQDIGGASGLKNLVRESLARVKVFIDLLLGVEPKFLGKSIDVPGLDLSQVER